MVLPFLTPSFVISILIALSVHEWAHGYAAYKLGDPTAKYDGRLTLNPIAHLDPMGTILFLLVGFGWGKPVPIDPRYFKNQRRDIALTALAGPASNLVLAFLATIGLVILHGNAGISIADIMSPSGNGNPIIILLTQIFSTSLFINLALMAFNLLPIAPLDGSKIIRPFIPYQYADQYEEFMRRGPMILIGLLIAEHFLHISILSGWVFGIISISLSFISALVGALPL